MLKNGGIFVNSTKNIITLGVLGFLIFIFIIGMNIGNTIYDTTDSVLSTMTTSTGSNITNSTLYLEQKTSKENVEAVFFDGFEAILYLLMAFTLYSSFVQKNSITSYLFSFVISVFAGALMIYLMTQFYNAFILQSGMLDMTNFPYFFFDNFQILVVVNILAGILSFIFVKREVA